MCTSLPPKSKQNTPASPPINGIIKARRVGEKLRCFFKECELFSLSLFFGVDEDRHE